MAHGIFLISCSDQKGITAAVTGFLAEHGGNIIDVEQHIDDQVNTFFMRVEWDLHGFALERADIEVAFAPIKKQYAMETVLSFSDDRTCMAVFASKHLHCLNDVLYRHKTGQLPCELPLVISNHPDAEALVKEYGVAFHCIPVEQGHKAEAEARQLALLKEYDINLIALARYHQIFSGAFVAQYPHQMINVHHSFLPAFVGQKPYQQAFEKGVKIIGATSHYVIEALDQGPIIEQDVARITHKHTVQDLIRIGEDLEKAVFNQAIRLHLQHKILCYNNKTVIFG